jgi:glutathione S-transferase
MEAGYRALRIMDNHLRYHRYFAADRYTIADIALYAHTHLAHTCDFDLTAFPAVRAWLDRMAGQPGHVLMDEQPAEAAQMQVHNIGPGWGNYQNAVGSARSPPSIPEFPSTENAINR